MSRAPIAETSVFVDRDVYPEEPPWAENGTYLAYLRIPQNIDVFNALDPATQDTIMGRSREGRRLDLPEDADLRNEPAIEGEVPSRSSHVRKAGPRGAERDTVQIFRRGLPFIETAADGSVTRGLHFASFQASLDNFRVVFNRWMLNPNFPPPAPGRQDELFQQGLVSIQRAGFYFVPGDSDEPLGTAMLQPHVPTTPRTPSTGRLAIRKRVLDVNGAEADADLSGFTFEVRTPTGEVIGEHFHTNPAGHAMSGTCRPTPTSSFTSSRRPHLCSLRQPNRSDWKPNGSCCV